MRHLYVAAFEVGQAFGGREEGGWWYDVGAPVDEPGAVVKVPARAGLVKRVRARLEAKYPRTGRRSSVNGGEDFDVKVSDEPPQAFPSSRPFYS